MKIYSRDEVLKASTDYFQGDDLAAEVFTAKYALRNDKLQWLEDNPDSMHQRMAGEFARIEKKYKNPLSKNAIYSLLKDFQYVVPGGSPMFGIGNPYQRVSLSNCFVIKTVDSYGGICRADERVAQISKRRGGVGIDISPIRPRGVATGNCALTTDGITVFMERFSNTSQEVAQSGRRGALMQTISVHHPEIMNFIRIKRDRKRVTGANISVRVTDEFMEAVKKNKTYELRWPTDSKDPVIKSKIKAREVWHAMIESVHDSAEPGILFWDNIIRNSPADCYSDLGFETSSTNPCGELPLCELDSCRLMSINLSSYVIDPFTENARFNEDLFRDHVGKAMRLMDDLVDLELEAITKIIDKVKSDPEDSLTKSNEMDMWSGVKKKCEQGRRTGLGITALGDCIAMLNVKYGDDESIKIVDHVYSILRNASYRASIQMAKERGAFPIFDTQREKGHEYLERLPDDIREDMAKYGRRNIGCLTTAPAGSISTVCRTTSGFEPIYKVEYFRKRRLTDTDKDKPDIIDDNGNRWKEYKIVHSKAKIFEEITGKKIEESPYYGAQCHEIDYAARVQMQATATKYVDHAISSTVNLPENIEIDVVEKIYFSAWEKGCKGLTVYREKSREGILTAGSSVTRSCQDCDQASEEFARMVSEGMRPKKIIQAAAPSRPQSMECDIHRSKVDKGDWLFFVGKLNGKVYEVFGGDSEQFTIPHKYRKGWILKNGKVDGVTQYNLVLGSLEDENEKLEVKGIAKHFNNYQYGAFTRLISLAIRHGTPIKYICEQITKTGVEGELFSFQRAMSRVLKKYIGEGEKCDANCPQCGSEDVYYKNGCPSCRICGHSNCS